MPDRKHRITLLGQFGMTIDGSPVDLPFTTKRVVAAVALGGNHGRSRLAGQLWPDSSEERARASLRSAIWQVRQSAPDLLSGATGSVQLTNDVYVDALHLAKAAHRAMGGAPIDPTDRVLRRLCERELLPDWNDEWLDSERDRYQTMRLHVLEALASSSAERRLFGLAIDSALAALRVDPLRETAHRALIRAHLAEGNVGAGLRAYRECVDVLEKEFGIAPSPETTDLIRTYLPTGSPGTMALHRVTARMHSIASVMTAFASMAAESPIAV